MAWSPTGPLFHFTGSTIVTFLMVFLIQRSQNKDSLALQLKLNEIVAKGRTRCVRRPRAPTGTSLRLEGQEPHDTDQA